MTHLMIHLSTLLFMVLFYIVLLWNWCQENSYLDSNTIQIPIYKKKFQ